MVSLNDAPGSGTITPWWIGRLGVTSVEKSRRWHWVTLMHQSSLTRRSKDFRSQGQRTHRVRRRGECLEVMQRSRWEGPWTPPDWYLLSPNLSTGWQNRALVLLCLSPYLMDAPVSTLSHPACSVFGFVLSYQFFIILPVDVTEQCNLRDMCSHKKNI